MAYKGTVKIPSGLTQLGTAKFPLTDAGDVNVNTAASTSSQDMLLSDLLDSIKSQLKHLTQEVRLESTTAVETDYGLLKKFSDGIWIGNSAPANASGKFSPAYGYNGIFFRFTDNTVYIVHDSTAQPISIGPSVAKFG